VNKGALLLQSRVAPESEEINLFMALSSRSGWWNGEPRV
jgi:hypothetical protein